MAALAVTKRLAVAAVEDKYRADFLCDLLTGRHTDLVGAVAHARSLGSDVDRTMVVIVAELDPGQVPQPALGHASATVTLRTYTHLWPTAEDRTRKAAAALIADVFASKIQPNPPRVRPASGCSA